jgi:hypothetical protein
MRKLALVILGLFVLVPVGVWAVTANNTSWNTAYEGLPADSDPLGDANEELHQTKLAIRNRAAVELCIGSGFTGSDDGCPVIGTGDNDNGRLREGAARAFYDNGPITALQNPDYDVGGGAGADGLDDGRLWIDSNDSNKFWVYNESAAAWQVVTVDRLTDEFDRDDEVLAGSYNLVYNGSFEATNGTGALDTGAISSAADGGGGTSVTFTTSTPHGMSVSDTVTITGTTDYNGTGIPINFVTGLTFNITDTWVSNQSGTWLNENPLPDGWTLIGTMNSYAYQTTETSEGPGLSLRTTVGANDSGIEQALTGLKASTQYKVLVRVKTGVGVTCRLHVDAKGGTDLANQNSTTSANYTTLSGNFTTDASADADIELLHPLTGTACDWDHVAVYEVGDTTVERDEVSQPGSVVFSDASSATGACTSTYAGCAAVVSVQVTPPGPGYVAMLSGVVHVGAPTEDIACVSRLWDGTTELIENHIGVDNEFGVAYTDYSLMSNYITDVLTPGTTVTYQIDVRETDSAARGCELFNSVGGSASETVEHKLRAVLVPTR